MKGVFVIVGTCFKQEPDTSIRERNASDISGLRRRFHVLHSALRNEGYHPLEASVLLASVLESHKRDAHASIELPERLKVKIEAFLAQLATNGAELSVAFQEFLGSQSRNGLGEYLTPLPVADLMATIAARESPTDVLDPFSGSGLLLERFAEKMPASRVFGIEINPSVACIGRAVGRLSAHNFQIFEGDAFSLWVDGAIRQCDAVLTNPPFGAVATTVELKELKGVVPDALLSLGSPPAELLGLELSVSALCNGGFLAIVLPQGVLTNARWRDYRANLFRRIHPFLLVSLPEETFAPFKGVAKACVLFARKEASSLPVRFLYFRSQGVGYDQTGRPAINDDLRDVTNFLDDVNSVNAMVNEAGLFICPPSDTGLNHAETYALGDIATIFTGRTLPRDGYTLNGPRILKVGDLSGSFISWRDRPRSHIPEAIFVKNPRCHLRVGDICLTSAAHRPRYIGLKVDMIDELPSEAAMASAEVLVIRLNPNGPITPEQLLFYLRSRAGYTQLQEMTRGSTAHLYPSDVERLSVPRLGGAEQAAALAGMFWAAASAFRNYLRLESEAAALTRLQANDISE